MDETDTDLKIYFILGNTLCWLDLPTLKAHKLKTPEGCLLQGLLPIKNCKIIVNGAKKVEEGYQEHKVFLVENGEFIEIKNHDFGIIGFQMVLNGDSLYLISDKKCQIYSLTYNTYRYIAEMETVHINPGSCLFNTSLYVIGGINNDTVEMFDPDFSYWTKAGELDISLFNIQCIQINTEEILIISCKEYFKFSPGAGKIIFQDWLPIRMKSHKIGQPVMHKNYVFCMFANSRLLRYNLVKGKWDINRSPNCCCSVI